MYRIIDTESGDMVRTFAATRLPAALYMTARLNLCLRPVCADTIDVATGQRFVLKSIRGDTETEVLTQ